MKSYLTELYRRVPKHLLEKEDYEQLVQVAKIRKRHGYEMEGDAELLQGLPINSLTNLNPQMKTTYEILESESPKAFDLLSEGQILEIYNKHKEKVDEREQASSEWARLEKNDPNELERIRREDPDRYDKMVEEFVTVTRAKGKGQRKSAFD